MSIESTESTDTGTGTKTFNLQPRLFKPTGGKFQHDIAVMLEQHPLAFDCIIFPAKHSDFDEKISEDTPQITMLDRDERLQEYDEPLQARAMIIPEGDDILFGLVENGSTENFSNMQQAIRMIVSVPNLRTYSLIQWREYEEHSTDTIVDRTVYIANSIPIGRGLNMWALHQCHPMLASGDIPAVEKTSTQATETTTGTDTETGSGSTTGSETQSNITESTEDFTPVDFSNMEGLMKNVEDEQ